MDDGIRVVLLDELAGLLQDLGDYDEPCASARPPPGRSPAASGTCGGVVDADSGSRGNRGNHARARLRAGCIAVGWLEDWRPACHAKPVGWADEGSPSSAHGTRLMGSWEKAWGKSGKPMRLRVIGMTAAPQSTATKRSDDSISSPSKR